MKYLKKYESLKKDLNPDIVRDICYDITDNGNFEVDIKPAEKYGRFFNLKHETYLVVFIKRSGIPASIQDREPFYFNEIKDVVYRIKDAIGIEKIKQFDILKYVNKYKGYITYDANILEREIVKNYKMLGMFIVFEK